MEGTDDPYMQMHLAGGLLSTICVGVKVIIEGPSNMDPYVKGRAVQ
jgi:hypothetical protein